LLFLFGMVAAAAKDLEQKYNDGSLDDDVDQDPAIDSALKVHSDMIRARACGSVWLTLVRDRVMFLNSEPKRRNCTRLKTFRRFVAVVLSL